jgi:hypothetical protein
MWGAAAQFNIEAVQVAFHCFVVPFVLFAVEKTKKGYCIMLVCC